MCDPALGPDVAKPTGDFFHFERGSFAMSDAAVMADQLRVRATIIFAQKLGGRFISQGVNYSGGAAVPRD